MGCAGRLLSPGASKESRPSGIKYLDFLSPLRGLTIHPLAVNSRLAPWAKLCRPTRGLRSPKVEPKFELVETELSQVFSKVSDNMAAIEPRELTQSPATGATPRRVGGNGADSGGGGRAKTAIALVGTEGRNGGGGRAATGPQAPVPHPASGDEARADESAVAEARGLKGWLRTFQIVRVLGTMSLYLFLNDYDIRAAYNQRVAGRKLEEARALGGRAHLRARARDLFLRRTLDKLIRLVRLLVFRGAEGTEGKERRLEKQGVWLKEHLIALGPTFIKIGQSLGTRADLLPLAYIKELATLQDQVPPFPTAEAFARVESELGRPVAEAFAEIDAAPRSEEHTSELQSLAYLV